MEEHGLQCGFCTPGMIMSSKHLLDNNPKPTEEEIFTAVSGVHRRCKGGYASIAMVAGYGIVGFRDPNGIRPLVVGKRDTDDGVEYMLGPYSSGMTKAIAPVSEKFGVPMVEAEGASRSLFTQGYKYLFAVLSTSEQYLATAIDFAAEKSSDPKSVKIALAFEGDPFSMDVRAGVMDKINEYGMKVVIDDQLPADLSDMSTTLTKVKALKPDALIISGHSKGAATAARQIDEMKVNVPMIALTHCEAAKVQEKFPKTANGFLCPTQWVETLSKSDPMFGSAADWNAGFKADYPSYTSVPYQSAQASAAVYVFKEAFEAANSFDKDKLRDAISAVEMETFYGDIKFSAQGNNIAKPMFMRQIDASGAYGLVEKAGDMVYPRNVAY